MQERRQAASFQNEMSWRTIREARRKERSHTRGFLQKSVEEFENTRDSIV
jgi:acetyl-CoA carboxylase alpha subunit